MSRGGRAARRAKSKCALVQHFAIGSQSKLAGRTPLGAEAEVVPRGEHGPCPPRAPPSDDLQRPSATSDQLVNDRHRRDRIMQSAAAIGSRWMSHLQLAQLGSKQGSCPRTVLPISVGTIRAVRHLVPRDIVLDAAVRDGEAHALQSLSDRSGSSKQGLSCARSIFLARAPRFAF